MNRILVPLLSLLCLSSCAGYSASFGCPDAQGMTCRPMSVVDRAINSGEIETVELKAKCKGKNCSKQQLTTAKPELKDGKIHRIELKEGEKEEDHYHEGEYIYLK
jgi:hypothetical protein